MSVGGHYAAGEDAKSAGPREIREELGLSIAFEELVPIGRRTFVYCFDEGITEYEFQDVFFLPHEVRPEILGLQADEVEGLLEMDVEEGIRLFSGKQKTAAGTLFQSLRSGAQASVSPNDFVPCLDRYYLKLLLLARRFFAGDRDCLLI